MRGKADESDGVCCGAERDRGGAWESTRHGKGGGAEERGEAWDHVLYIYMKELRVCLV